MPLNAVLLDCAPPGTPADDAPLHQLQAAYRSLGIDADILALPDSADDDQWALLVATVQASDIIVVAPVRGVVVAARLLIDRLAADPASLHDTVAAVLMPGGDDEGDASGALMAELSRLGCTIAPTADPDRVAADTVRLAEALNDEPAQPEESTRPRQLFGALPTGSLGLDPAAIDAEKRAAAEGRLIERRRLVDLTRKEKGLPEKRSLPRPPLPGEPPR